MRIFKDQKHTKTDDIGYLIEVISRSLLPYFFVLTGAGIIWVGASLKNAIDPDSRNIALSIGGGLTAAGLAVANPQGGEKKDESKGYITDEANDRNINI